MNLTNDTKKEFIRLLEKHPIRIESIEPDVESINGFDVCIDRVCIAVKGQKLHEMKPEHFLGGEIEPSYTVAELEKVLAYCWKQYSDDNNKFFKKLSEFWHPEMMFENSDEVFMKCLNNKKCVEEILNEA